MVQKLLLSSSNFQTKLILLYAIVLLLSVTVLKLSTCVAVRQQTTVVSFKTEYVFRQGVVSHSQ